MGAKSLGTIELVDSSGCLHIACQLHQAALPLYIRDLQCPRTTSVWRLRDGRRLTTDDGITFKDLDGRIYALMR
jgi:hypothetical protein